MNIASVPRDALARFGERTTLHFEGRDWRNTEIHHRAGQLAAALRELGVVPGDRVALITPNSPYVGMAYDAIPRIGAVCVPVLFVLPAPELRVVFADAEPRVALVGEEVAQVVADAVEGLPSPPRLVVLGSAEAEALLDAQEPDTDLVERDATDPAVLVFTGGTTGRPKGVVLTHGNLLAQVEMVAGVFSYGPEDVTLGVLPMAHLFGLASSLTTAQFGMRSVLQRWFTPEAVLRAIPEHRVTITAMVPTMLSLVLAHPDVETTDFSSLRQIVVGASPLPIELARAWEERTGSRILQGYGLTETTAGVCVERRDGPRRPGSCGLPYPGTEVRVVDDDLHDVPVGEPGEILVRGPQVTPGYWHNPEATAATIVDGWLRTGDVGHVDDDGCVYVTDRMKDLVIRGGLNVYPRDVEEVLYLHPDVLEAAVVGRPDDVLGERVVACIVPRAGAELQPDDLSAWCRERLAGYKTPDDVVVLDALPKSPIGKVLKKDLRALVVGSPPAG